MPRSKSASALLTTLGVLICSAAASGGLERALSAAERSSVRGGADCLTDGTANCPTAKACSGTACQRSGTTTLCPNGTTGETQVATKYAQTAVVPPPGQGRTGKKNQPDITCTQEITCNGCSGNVVVPGNCKDGANTATPPVQRTPTKVDPASAACPAS